MDALWKTFGDPKGANHDLCGICHILPRFFLFAPHSSCLGPELSYFMPPCAFVVVFPVPAPALPPHQCFTPV